MISRAESNISRLARGEPRVEGGRGGLDPDTIDALSDRGLTAVPVKPTPEMIAAGSAAGAVSARLAFEIYQAMIGQAMAGA